jgi:hypothetical protein
MVGSNDLTKDREANWPANTGAAAALNIISVAVLLGVTAIG